MEGGPSKTMRRHAEAGMCGCRVENIAMLTLLTIERLPLVDVLPCRNDNNMEWGGKARGE